jgi:hypothetical protein
MMRKNGPDNEQSLILLPPAPDTISQQEIAHPSDISNHFLAEELVFDKKNIALRPSLLGPCRFRVKRGILNTVQSRFFQFFSNEPDRL